MENRQHDTQVTAIVQYDGVMVFSAFVPRDKNGGTKADTLPVF
ncbi:hypothetical protein [Pectobacterium parmentieri]|nr:hypothetical protein [Pectobacterium parmentieri]